MQKIGNFAVLLCFLQFGFGLASPSTPQEKPVVKIVAYNTARYYSGDLVDDPSNTENLTMYKKTAYIVPTTVSQVVMECNDSFPVMWNLAESDINGEMFSFIRVYTKRYSENVLIPDTFRYTTRLVLGGPSNSFKFTGNYICQRTAKRSAQTSVFIYWDASGLETLVHSGETLYINVKNGVVKLPCGVCSPEDSKPKLQKILISGKTKTYSQLNENKSISYSASQGFTLTNLPNPAGTYRCVVDESRGDMVTIIVKNGANYRNPNASLTYDEEKNQIVCCSKRAPDIFMFHCDHAITCQLREHILEPYHYVFSRAKKNATCSVMSIRYSQTSLARCKGDGIDEYMHIIMPIKIHEPWPWNEHDKTTKLKTYLSWDQIEQHEMLAVEIQPNLHFNHYSPESAISRVYENQTVYAECSMSQYYFSEGARWAILWKNKSTTFVNEKTISNVGYLMQSDILTKKLDFSMEAFICFAPQWNTTTWVNKVYHLYVNQTVSPLLKANDTVKYTFTTNETRELVCEGKGDPMPTFTWLQGSAVIRNDDHKYNISTMQKNGSEYAQSTLKILRVSYSTHGEFICSASNFGGKMTRSFIITVVEPSSWKTTTVLVVSLLIICVLIVAIWFLWKHWKSNEQAIRQLATVRFNDAMTRDQANGTEVANSTWDSSKMTNQLIT